MKYRIITVQEKRVCVPSDDYYAKGNDWSKDEISYIEHIPLLFDSVEECVEHVKNDLPKGEYMFIPVYIKE